jgi:thymidylate synthase
MKYKFIEAFDCPSAWFKTVSAIWNEGDDYKVDVGSEETLTKKLNLSLRILNPETRPLINDKAPLDSKYLNEYALKYLWLANDNPKEAYTYGDRIRSPIDQLDFIIEQHAYELQHGICGNRQLTLAIRDREDLWEEHPPCLSIIDTEVLGNKMNLTCYLRSWDAYAGLPCNIAGLQLFNEALVNEINDRGKLDIQTGELIFHSKNCHLYSRQFKLVEELVSNKRGKNI